MADTYIQYELLQARPAAIAHRIGFMSHDELAEWMALGWVVKHQYPNTPMVKDKAGRLVREGSRTIE